MKNISFLLLLGVLLGCNHPDKLQTKQTTPVKPKPNVTSAADKDSVVIDTIDGEKIKYAKDYLQKILTYYPEFKDSVPSPPDMAYATRGTFGKPYQKDDEHYISFGSEAGQDDYYELYAYYLKMNDGGEKYQTKRKNLILLYLDINEIFARLKGGGTFFGHQHTRILGYAEYSIFIYGYEKKYGDLKTYSVSKQKQLYISLLKQHITDELSSNFDIPENEKSKLKQQLFETVNHINGLITEYFYLEQVQTFQYSNY
jgi:hypothetical protein